MLVNKTVKTLSSWKFFLVRRDDINKQAIKLPGQCQTWENVMKKIKQG